MNTDTIIIKLEFDQPELLPATDKMSAIRFVSPVRKTILIQCESSAFSIENIGSEARNFLESSVYPVRDIPLGESTNLQDQWMLPVNPYESHLLGTFQGKNIYQLTISSLIADQNNQQAVRWIKQLQLKCIGNSLKALTDGKERQDIISKIINSKSSIISLGKNKQDLSFSEQITPGTKRLKIWIKEEGMYLLSHAMIEDAGFEISGVNPRYLRIFSRNGEVPIRIVGGDDGSFDFTDYIEFYGEPIWDTKRQNEIRKHIYTTQNIYWLEISDHLGLRMGQEDARVTNRVLQTSRSYLYKEHFEEDRHFNRLPYALDVSGADYWFYSSGVAGEEQRSFSCELKKPDAFSTQLASIRVKLRSQSQSFDTYTAEVYLNDHYVGMASYTGNQEFWIETQNFSPTYLKETNNQLSLLNKANQEALTYIYLDWFEITYPRLYEPVDDYIRFTPPRYSNSKRIEFRLPGFSEPDISLYKINSSRLLGSQVREVTDTLGVITYTLVYQDSILDENTEYIAVTPSAKLLPDSLMSVEFIGLEKSNLGADYVVITPADSLGMEPLAPLLQLRESQGYKTFVVNVDTLYNEFNWGVPDGLAIQRFLTYAYHSWNPKPKYVLLIGDGYYDNRAEPEKGAYLPVELFQTYKYGGAPTDHFYTLLDGNDELPEIAVGRLPVRDKEELSRVVNKIVSFEESPPSPWKNRYLLIGAGTGDDIFRKQSETIITDILPKALSPKRLYLSGSLSDPYVGGTEDLLRALEEGLGMVNFRGHGGGAIWADAGLLDLDDIELIENRHFLPFMTSMTCFTGDFASSRTCLGEALVDQGESGAVAFWGATGVGWTNTDFTLLQEMYALIDRPEINTIGELIRQAKINFRMFNIGDIAESELYQYTLIGDPATRLPFPKQTIDFQVTPKSMKPGETIKITGNSNIGQSNIYLEVTKSNFDAVKDELLESNQSQWDVMLPSSESLSKGQAGVRLLSWDEATNFFSHGFESFQIGSAFFDSISTVPVRLTNHDSIDFTAIVESASPIAYMWCQIFSPVTDSIPLVETFEHHYASVRPIGPYSAGKTIQYTLHIALEGGEVQSSDQMIATVQNLPDLAIQSIKITGTESVSLETVIRNYSLSLTESDNQKDIQENTIQSVIIRFEMPDLSWIQYDTLSMPGVNEYIHHMIFYPPSRITKMIVTINPDSSISETSFQNNQRIVYLQPDRFNVTPAIGSLTINQENGYVGLDNKIKCNIPSGAISKPSVVLIQDKSSTQINEYGAEEIQTEYYINLPEVTEYPKLKREMSLYIQSLVTDTTGYSRVYHRYSIDRPWAFLSSEKEQDQFKLNTRETGYFSIRSTKDIEPPEIEIQIENQPFTNNCYVSRQPTISIIIRDESGVDIRTDKIIIELNHQIQGASYFSVPDSLTDQKQVIVTYQPVLKPGKHQLLIKASDIHGNVREPQFYSFQVASQFEIQFLGNYPNPFKRETTFVYILTESAQEATLKIYTVSGRLIKVFDGYELTSPDYHELVWDGTDDYGNEVANGVYFFKLDAKGLSTKQEVTGKIAKIR